MSAIGFKCPNGDKVRFEGKIYESLIDANTYSPSAYPLGWQEVEA